MERGKLMGGLQTVAAQSAIKIPEAEASGQGKNYLRFL